MDYDFNSRHLSSEQKRSRLLRPGWYIVAALIAFGLYFLFPDSTPPEKGHIRISVKSPVISAEAKPAPPPEPPAPVRKERKGMVQPGDSITTLLSEWFTPRDIHLLNQQSKEVFPLHALSAGQPFRVSTVDDRFDSFVYDIDREEQFIIRHDGQQFALERTSIPYRVATDIVEGSIQSSLFEAMMASGEGPELAINMADIFAWDIDFIRDLRTGDSFKLLVEKRYRDGNFSNYGRILAAEFINRGETHRAVLFKDGKQAPDYYDPNGRSLRKAFLKAPLKFSRISSGFSYRRKHPITGDYKPHLAIDYAAPSGTPVKAIGDGTIVARGYDKYSGNKLKVRHPNGYVSVYIHLKGFAKRMVRGKKVRQGQTIAYVGNTGRSTGPHLDFRMLKNGKPVNPLKVKSPAARPVSKEYRAAFKALAQSVLAKFDTQPPPNSGEIRQAARVAETDKAIQ